jgi:hypothetical protein
MLPVTQLIVGAGVATGAALAGMADTAAVGVAGAGVAVGAGVGVALAEVQAAANMAAAMASAPKRLVPLSNVISSVLGC